MQSAPAVPRRRAPQRPRPAAAPAEMDMTSMIDVTFQLIVFFLVANDLSRREIVDLVLPVALHAESDVPVPAGRVVMNVRRPADPGQALPVVTIAGRDVPWRDLARTLRGMAQARRAHADHAVDDPTALVRADTTTPWRHVQLVMQACAEPGVAIRKIQFATTRGPDGPVPAGE